MDAISRKEQYYYGKFPSLLLITYKLTPDFLIINTALQVSRMTKLSANIKTEAGQSPAQEDSYSLLSHICENLTTVCHVFVVGLAFFFIYLATLETYQLFIWHPVCFSIGVSIILQHLTLVLFVTLMS